MAPDALRERRSPSVASPIGPTVFAHPAQMISWSRPSDRSSSTLDAVADVRGVGRVQNLDGHRAQVADVVEQALAGAE
jgi:hypothetical protein